jgi:hypothetical protein
LLCGRRTPLMALVHRYLKVYCTPNTLSTNRRIERQLTPVRGRHTFWDPQSKGEWLSLSGVVYKWSQTVLRIIVYSTHWYNMEEVICCFDQYQRTLVSVYSFPIPVWNSFSSTSDTEGILYTINSESSLYTASTHELLFCYRENKLVLTLNFDNSAYSVPESFSLDYSCWYEDQSTEGCTFY